MHNYIQLNAQAENRILVRKCTHIRSHVAIVNLQMHSLFNLINVLVKLSLHAFTEAAGPHLLEPTGASLVDLCIRFGLTSDDIDKEVSDSDILNIYQQLEKWEELANHLGLTRAEIEVIEGKAVRDVELKRLLLLQKWKNKGIAAGTAVTYRVLIQALLKCHCSSSAISVCKLITNVVEPKQ